MLPHWLLQPEDFWMRTQRKGIMVFALPGEPGLTELAGDFKIYFHDRQGDFYWFAIDPCFFQHFVYVCVPQISMLIVI